MHLDLHQNHNHPKFANNLKTQGKKHLIREGDDAAFVISTAEVRSATTAIENIHCMHLWCQLLILSGIYFAVDAFSPKGLFQCLKHLQK